jgi:hypothetical protein
MQEGGHSNSSANKGNRGGQNVNEAGLLIAFDGEDCCDTETSVMERMKRGQSETSDWPCTCLEAKF